MEIREATMQDIKPIYEMLLNMHSETKIKLAPVNPEKRNSLAAIKLVKNFIYSGNSAKLKIKLGHVFSGDIERKDKFFERLGLTKAGSLFVEI